MENPVINRNDTIYALLWCLPVVAFFMSLLTFLLSPSVQLASLAAKTSLLAYSLAIICISVFRMSQNAGTSFFTGLLVLTLTGFTPWLGVWLLFAVATVATVAEFRHLRHDFKKINAKLICWTSLAIFLHRLRFRA